MKVRCNRILFISWKDAEKPQIQRQKNDNVINSMMFGDSVRTMKAFFLSNVFTKILESEFLKL